ncbi:hypothetical protein DSECCO2_456880 [anaerobic digester metagenome]
MGRQEVMLTLEPEDLPALITQTLRAIEEVFFLQAFCDLTIFLEMVRFFYGKKHQYCHSEVLHCDRAGFLYQNVQW